MLSACCLFYNIFSLAVWGNFELHLQNTRSKQTSGPSSTLTIHFFCFAFFCVLGSRLLFSYEKSLVEKLESPKHGTLFYFYQLMVSDPY